MGCLAGYRAVPMAAVMLATALCSGRSRCGGESRSADLSVSGRSAWHERQQSSITSQRPRVRDRRTHYWLCGDTACGVLPQHRQ